MPDTAGRRRRADAERSIAAVLDAAVDVLGARPDAGMGDIAAAAGVTRQTVYAHFGSREALLTAVAERAMAATLAAVERAAPEDGPPAAALERLVEAWWAEVGRHARVIEALAVTLPSPEEVHAFHGPVLERLERLARRGQRDGAFDAAVTPGWLAAAFLGLVHTAAAEVAAGRMGDAEAGTALRAAILRVYGAG